MYGREVTENGKPPPERVVVTMDCGAQVGPQPQDYTDSKGRFSFTPGINRTVISVDSACSWLRCGGKPRAALGANDWG